MKDFHTQTDSTITLTSGKTTTSVDLYSRDGRDLICSLYLKLAVKYRWMYEPKWLGIPIIQLPNDILMLEELIWSIKPDCIIECGVAHGGSAIFYASLLELIGNGKVIGVDVEIRSQNRANIEAHPLHHRIHLIEGSSIAPSTLTKIQDAVGGAQKIMVLLDSNHTSQHVLEEMNLYAPLVSSGSYLVVMDGAQAYVGDVPNGKPEWSTDHPLMAIEQFLQSNPDFSIDPNYTRLIVTSNPSGYLRKN